MALHSPPHVVAGQEHPANIGAHWRSGGHDRGGFVCEGAMMQKLIIAPLRFTVTQPPGQEPPVVEGEVNSLDLAIREGGHYHRVYMQDGPARLTVTDLVGTVVFMASGGRKVPA